MKEQFELLRKPLPLRWKPQSTKGTKAICVAFINSRDVQERLDEVFGPENWQDQYESHAGKLFCKIGIRCGDEWIWKSDAGIDTQVAADKGAASDAFKRAAVKWGVRAAYDAEQQYLDKKEYKSKEYPIDDKGNILWNESKLSAYINAMIEKGGEV